MRDGSENHPLPGWLDLAVAMALLDLRARGGPTDADRERAGEFALRLGEKGDVLLFGGKRGEAGALAAELARHLAVLAYQPGGVRLFGRHWTAEEER